jgi:hypothetical protein
MNSSHDAKGRAHIRRVKELPCSLCDAPGPSQAHHIDQTQAYTCVALCPSCHGGPGYPSGWHGTKTLWRIKKMDELSCLNVTIKRLMEEA